MSSEQQSREFEVGVCQAGNFDDYDHITVTAESPEQAAEKAKDESSYRYPFAYQAFEIDAMVTHDV